MASPVFDPNSPKRIVNGNYSKQAVDLIYGNPNGTVSGFGINDTMNQHWFIEPSVRGTFNIRSGTGPDVYAYVHTILDGTPVVGSVSSVTSWNIVPVGTDTYRIQTKDNAFTWVLENGENYFTILLRPTAKWQSEQKAYWKVQDI